MFTTPILFIVFNRPSTTKQVFDRIRLIKPKYLYVAADGPRVNNSSDIQNCNQVKSIINEIDWDCELKTLYRDENLGCGKGVSQAISWFFNQVEYGIILEDDCLPDISFFQFAQEMLIKYENNQHIMIVAGTNPIADKFPMKTSYTFGYTAGIWGWASWKRAWNYYNYTIPEWSNPEVQAQFINFTNNPIWENQFIDGLNKVNKGLLDTWDYQWLFYRMVNNGMGIIPKTNLISNIGFGSLATHTFEENHEMANKSTNSLTFPLIHPNYIIPNNNYDSFLINYFSELNKIVWYKSIYYKFLTLLKSLK